MWPEHLGNFLFAPCCYFACVADLIRTPFAQMDCFFLGYI